MFCHTKICLEFFFMLLYIFLILTSCTQCIINGIFELSNEILVVTYFHATHFSFLEMRGYYSPCVFVF